MCLKCEKANSGKQCYEKILPNLGESTSHVNPDLPTYVDAAEIDIAKAADNVKYQLIIGKWDSARRYNFPPRFVNF